MDEITPVRSCEIRPCAFSVHITKERDMLEPSQGEAEAEGNNRIDRCKLIHFIAQNCILTSPISIASVESLVNDIKMPTKVI